MKRLIVILLISLFTFVANPIAASAEEVTTCVQTTQYGGQVGIVCGAKHEPVETGLADINPLTLASIFFIFSGFGIYNYRKLQKSDISLN
jgi:hypothetical protein